MSNRRGLLWRYYAYRASTSLGFYVPVSVYYLLDRGFGVEFVALAQAVFSFSLLLAEIPTGYVGDRLGRRASLALGNGFRVASLLGYVVADAGVAFLALKVLTATGWAFRSGTVDAWLYEVLKARFDEDAFSQIESRGRTVLLLTSAVTAVAGGALYSVDAAWPFLANAALAAAGLPILYTFPAVETDADDEAPLSVVAAASTLRAQASRPAIRWLVVYVVTIATVLNLSRTFEQPALDVVGVPAAGMGVLYAAFKLASAGAAASVGRIEDALGVHTAFALLVPVVGLAYASLVVLPVAVVPVLFLYRGVRAVLHPLQNQYLNDRLEDVGRATVLSGVSMLGSLVGGVARLASGPLAASTGPIRFLGLAGVGLAAVAGVVWVATSPLDHDDHSGETRAVTEVD